MLDEQIRKAWRKKRTYTEEELALARKVLEAVRDGQEVRNAQRMYPLPGGAGFLAKHALVAAYRRLVEQEVWEEDPVLLAKIRMKPIRTLSGVTTLTVLTKPHPCPGECVFCPTIEGMPQSYLPDEPGARRGLENEFDPYRQVASRLKALHDVGHPTEKIELLILGGSWSAYPKDYREWFLRRCFEAMNGENPLDDQGDVSLYDVQARNVNAEKRNVGLVIETRPDLINAEELKLLRKQGVTKIQIGIQSMNDEILEKNRRGHDSATTLKATALLREAGFKITAHWMPNLLGSTPDLDKEDFKRLWEENGVNPDELKIYPCQLLNSAPLYGIWQDGDYEPYDETTLLNLLADIKTMVPRYCRINRVIRDIPSTNVIEGSRNTSLRQDVAVEMARRGTKCECVRCREIREQRMEAGELVYDDFSYQAAGAEEHFLSYNTADDKLAGFLRLSLPNDDNALDIDDLKDAAIIREVHVYGQSLEVGTEQEGMAQHAGIGKALIAHAEQIAKDHGYQKIAVIAAVGTRAYYAGRGFELGELYMVKPV
ncbi:MAG TPA: tRNA uridine(34) 5-carboxymethylaminomethyl modification radical SAM/GNAT enzyme Elp3 [Anaerolineaceae bacterium]|jgi:elongator complex protein 3|nr:tRNA uridine(34) 5-carboxymethylaminomethyl modification radical SAM/GNAT enzyme Elp3 [Anaerolineaceae bacterium]